MNRKQVGGILWVGLIAGIAGGIAEVAWIAAHAALANASGHAVAVAVADTLGLGTGNPAVDLWLGIGSHLGLAVLIGIGLTTIIRSRWCRLPSASAEAFAVVGLLVAIWGFNFFILLPVANPAFVQIMPYEITFLSKVLFGVAAAGVLYAERSWRSVLLGWAELGARFGRSNA